MDTLQKIGIDQWSILLYLVNTGILLVVLTKLLYRPFLKMMDERRDTIRNNLQEAELLRQTLAEQAKKQEQETKDLLLKMQSDVATAKAQAEMRAKKLLEEADAQREEMLEQTRQQIEEEKSLLLKGAEKETQKRIEQTILHVLKDKIPADVVKASVQSAWKDLHS